MFTSVRRTDVNVLSCVKDSRLTFHLPQSLLWHTCVPAVVHSSPCVACSGIPCIFVKKNETRMCCDCATTMKIPRRVRYECVKTNNHMREFARIYAANST